MDLLSNAVHVALDTITYLMAYRLAPVAAIGTSLVLIAFSARRACDARLSASNATTRALAATALGIARPVTAREIERNVKALQGRPFSIVLYLAASHNWTVYYLFLIGPLLGKDVLLSHLIGGIFFVAFGGALVALTGSRDVQPMAPSAAGREGAASIVLSELVHAITLIAWGLLLGGLVGAFGMSGPIHPPALVSHSPVISQIVNAFLGAAVSAVGFMWPVANLFVGTYLWKIGLAHAGIVSFFYASTVSPQRVLLYSRIMGKRATARFVPALALAALLAGVATALLFRLSGLTIHYKLIPAQLL